MKSGVSINYNLRNPSFLQGLAKLYKRLDGTITIYSKVNHFIHRKTFLKQPWISFRII